MVYSPMPKVLGIIKTGFSLLAVSSNTIMTLNEQNCKTWEDLLH
jgi:hypothetical protein